MAPDVCARDAVVVRVIRVVITSAEIMQRNINFTYK